jgi:phospholipid/cholesterol/gamma-HCH transport system substrate-binding protein
MSTEIKVGVLVIIALLVFGYFVIRIEDIGAFGQDEGYPIFVLFDNAAGLGVDDPVLLAGVRVGRVSGVSLTDDGRAQAELRMSPEIQLYQDAVAVVGSSGMLGDRIVDLSPGTPGGAILAPGGTIRGGEPVSVDQMVTVVASIARNLDRTAASIGRVLGTQEGEASLREILGNLESITAQMDNVVADNRSSIDSSLGNLETTLGNFNSLTVDLAETLPALVADLRRVSGEISEVLGANQGDVGDATTNLRSMTERLDRSAAELEELISKMNRGEGTVGRLVNESETVDRLNEALDSVDDSLAAADTFFRRVGEARFSFEWRSEFYERIEATKNYFGLRLQIGEVDAGRGFEFHLIDDNIGGLTERTTLTEFLDPTNGDILGKSFQREIIREEGFRFNAVIAQRVRNFQVRGGILENQAGLGLDLFAARDKLRLTGEIWDLGRDPDPHAKLRLQWQVTGRFFITGGWDDILRSDLRGYYLGGGYSFRQ